MVQMIKKSVRRARWTFDLKVGGSILVFAIVLLPQTRKFTLHWTSLFTQVYKWVQMILRYGPARKGRGGGGSE